MHACALVKVFWQLPSQDRQHAWEAWPLLFTKMIAPGNILPIPMLNCKVYSLKILFKGSFWVTILIIWFLTEKILILQVLFLELKLPPNGEMKMQSSKKTLGSTRRGTESNHKLRLGRRFSTSKVLWGAHGVESKLLAFDAVERCWWHQEPHSPHWLIQIEASGLVVFRVL